MKDIVYITNEIRSGRIRIKQVLDHYFSEIDKTESQIQAWILIDRDSAYKKAEMIQKRIDAGEAVGRLAGIPIGIKDNICTAHMVTTCASGMLEQFQPPYSATAVSLLEQEDAIIIGKTNMDEFGMGNSTRTSYYKTTKNPHNLSKTAGGSSGGSAAAVAAGHIPVALGTDTGGSIRQPSSYCGVVGLKPSYGSVSRNGLIAYASSMDQIGPIATSVSDCKTIFEILSSYDKGDGSMCTCKPRLNPLSANLEGYRIGLLSDGQSQFYALFEKLKEAVIRQGAIIEDITFPLLDYGVPAYYILACAEASSNLERYDGIKYGYHSKEEHSLESFYQETRTDGFGWEVKQRVLLGTYVLSESFYEDYYKKALQVKALLTREWKRMFQTYDAVVMPVTSQTAPDSSKLSKSCAERYKEDRYTVPANLSGFPSISICAGRDKDKMPIGIQIMADAFCEDTVLQIAYGIEQSMSEEGCNR